jgi:hypothetical protein
MAMRLLPSFLFFLTCFAANADELIGRWADNPKSCRGDRSGSGSDGTDFQVMDLNRLNLSFFDSDVCPMLEYSPKINTQAGRTHVYRVYCKGEEGNGPIFWLFITRESNRLSVLRINPRGNEAPFRYSLGQCI